MKMIEIYKTLASKAVLHSFTRRQYLLCKMMFVFRLSYTNLTRQRIAQIYVRSYTDRVDVNSIFRIILHVTYICTPPGSRRNCRYSRPLYHRPTRLECICHWRTGTASKDRLIYLRTKEKVY